MFKEKTSVSQICIQFQGGFSCKQIEVKNCDGDDGIIVQSLYPEDTNNKQTFPLDAPLEVRSLKLLLTQPTDFFGRIIIYHLDFLS